MWAADTAAVSAALAELFEATVSLYWRLTADAASIHKQGELSGPRRTVLLSLARSGPRTVAHLARARAQTRQRIQPIVNQLIADGLATLQPNPVHQRSMLVELTAKGRRAASAIDKLEFRLRAQLKPASSPRTLRQAARALHDVRRALERDLPAALRKRIRRRGRR